MMLKLKNKIAGLIWASSRETKCPEGDSILSLKNQQPDTITGDFLAHRLIINNVDWAHAELAWHKDMKKQQTVAIGDSSPVWELETAFPVSCLTFMLLQSDTGREKVKKTDCVYLRDVRSQKKAKKKKMKNLEHLSVICTEPLQAARCRYFIYWSVCLVYLHNSAASVKLFRNIHRKMRAFNRIPFKLPLGLIIQKRLSQNFW